MADSIDHELASVQSDIARVVSSQPVAVILAALRTYKKLQLYRGIRSVLTRQGIR